LSELYQVLESSRERRYEDRKFAAALKGVDLDKEAGVSEDSESSFDAIKRRAEAKLRGMTEEQYELTEIGIGIVDDE
jgi:hypothetical protein